MTEQDLKKMVQELEAIRADPVRSAEFDKKMQKSMSELSKKWAEDREKERLRKLKEIEHWIRIKDIPFMWAV